MSHPFARLLLLPALLTALPAAVTAQMYGTARVGVSVISVRGVMQNQDVQWGGSTFLFSGGAGYGIYSAAIGETRYLLEIEAAVNYSTFNFIRTGQGNRYGNDYYTRNGFDGANSVITVFELRSVHRIKFHSDDWYSPFVSAGFSGTVFSTTDLHQRGAFASIKGTRATFPGVDLSYGVTIEALDIIKPYIMFNHYFLFGPEFIPLEGMAASSRPSTFVASAGIRFEL